MDIIAGLDAAVRDSVDVLSFSIGSYSSMQFNYDPIAIAAFKAMERDIFVSCAVGNAGPEPGTIGNGAPWMLTVVAGTMDHAIRTNVKLVNSEEFHSESLFQPRNNSAAGPLLLVYRGQTASTPAATAACCAALRWPARSCSARTGAWTVACTHDGGYEIGARGSNDRCQRERREAITGEDLLWGMSCVGFDNYVDPLNIFLHRYHEFKGAASGVGLAPGAVRIGGGGSNLHHLPMAPHHHGMLLQDWFDMPHHGGQYVPYPYEPVYGGQHAMVAYYGGAAYAPGNDDERGWVALSGNGGHRLVLVAGRHLLLVLRPQQGQPWHPEAGHHGARHEHPRRVGVERFAHGVLLQRGEPLLLRRVRDVHVHGPLHT